MRNVLPIISFLFYTILFPGLSVADETPLIKVSAHGIASALPDQAQFNLNFRVVELEVESANNTINKRVKKFLNGLENFELETQSLDSGQIHITPQYRYRNKERVFSGYQVERTVSFTLNQLSQLQDIISFISSSNVTSINYVNYRYSNEEILKDEALGNAIRKATRLAESIAEGFNVELSTIQSVHHQAIRNNMPPMRMARSMVAESAPEISNYKVKPIEVEAYIDVEFNFED